MNIFILVLVLILQTPEGKAVKVMSNGYASQEECETARATVTAAADKDSDVLGYTVSPCGEVPLPTKV